MSKDAVNFLTNLKEEVNKYIADVDLESVEKAADILGLKIETIESWRKGIKSNCVVLLLIPSL